MNKTVQLMALIPASVAVMGSSVLAYGASASISIGPTSTFAESGTIGSAYSAFYMGYNSLSSTNDLWVEAHAQWVGWPFTLEQDHLLEPGEEIYFEETQQYNSNFHVALNPDGAGGKGCYGSGSCELR
jgi:hypothetical protein